MSTVVTLRKIPGHGQGAVVENVDAHDAFWTQQILAGNAVVLAEDEPDDEVSPEKFDRILGGDTLLAIKDVGHIHEEADDLDIARVIEDEVAAVIFDSDDELLDYFDSFDDDLTDPED